MSLTLTPDRLFQHAIIVHHYEPGPYGTLATPVPATEAVTGHIQIYSHVIRMKESEESQARGAVTLPYTVILGPQDEIEHAGEFYRLANISTPNLGGSTNAYTRAELI